MCFSGSHRLNSLSMPGQAGETRAAGSAELALSLIEHGPQVLDIVRLAARGCSMGNFVDRSSSQFGQELPGIDQSCPGLDRIRPESSQV